MNNFRETTTGSGYLKICCHNILGQYIGCDKLNIYNNKDLYKINSFSEPHILTITQDYQVNLDILFDCQSFTNTTIKKLILIKSDYDILKITKYLSVLEEIMLDEFKLNDINYRKIRKLLNSLMFLKKIILRNIDYDNSFYVKENIINYCKYRNIELEFW